VTGRPLVSVIVPVKNGERFLPDALGDVVAQTYENVEILVVDGRSTDRSAEIARSFPGVRVIEQPDDGLWQAWNLGLAEARGDLIAFLDSDDRWAPDKLEAQVTLLEQDAGLDYVITHAGFFLEPGKPRPPRFDPALLEGSHVANMPSAILARRSVFDVIGDFPTDFEIAGDIDWFARLKDSGLRRAVIDAPMVMKRVHDTNLSYFTGASMETEILRVLRESVARQRR
jgi:glycosyltransferase involved in cell wall biosynthesis